jgi:hypothetical protein
MTMCAFFNGATTRSLGRLRFVESSGESDMAFTVTAD